MGVFKCINQSQTKRGFTGVKVGEGVGFFFVPFCGFSGLSKLPEFLSSPSVHPSTNLLGSSFLALDFILYLPNLLHISVFIIVFLHSTLWSINDDVCCCCCFFFVPGDSWDQLPSSVLSVLKSRTMNSWWCHHEWCSAPLSRRWAAGSSLWLLSLSLITWTLLW